MTRNQLLVEGKDDLHAVIHLMKAHTPWPEDKDTWPVEVKDFKGVPRLLKDGEISAYLKSPKFDRVGIVVDANGSAFHRWEAIRNQSLTEFPLLPVSLPSEGVIITNDRGRHFGVWIMPNNSEQGMLETFLALIRPTSSDDLWRHAEASVQHAQALGAPIKATHVDKAKIHTWLAWQEDPGLEFGRAISKRCLDANSPYASPFVTWFKKLFDLS